MPGVFGLAVMLLTLAAKKYPVEVSKTHWPELSKKGKSHPVHYVFEIPVHWFGVHEAEQNQQ